MALGQKVSRAMFSTINPLAKVKIDQARLMLFQTPSDLAYCLSIWPSIQPN